MESTSDGLLFSEDLSAEELATVINELADTYCSDANCGKTGSKCETCQIGDKAFKIRKTLIGR